MSIYKKISISPLFLLLILLSFISGLFKDILSLFIIIIIHELGHIITSLLFKWNIKKININIYGGYIIYEEDIDKPFKEEFTIAISGILMQSMFYLFLVVLNKINIMDIDTLFMFKKYHYSVLIFNLIPVIPLDGAKILNIILNLFLPYKKSLETINLISLISIIILIIIFISLRIKIEYSYIIILSFILSSIYKNIIEAPYLFNKFIFERYKNNKYYKKRNYIKSKNINDIKRQKSNYFYINGTYYNEKYILSKRFNIDDKLKVL